VLMMVLETWLLNIILLIMQGDGASTGLGDTSILRMVRLLRLTRMARMARLLRAMPELMILIKGVAEATRSVVMTLVLLTLVIYVFAIAFTQLTEGTTLGDDRFSTISRSMSTLLLRGTLPDLADLIEEVGNQHELYAAFFLLFVLLSSLTVLNMLVGVLVEVVGVVSAVEKEQMTVQFVKWKLLDLLKAHGIEEEDCNGEMEISRSEFETLLLNPTAARMIRDVGVDVVGLVDFADFIFSDSDTLSFQEFMELVLQLRGSNTATVKDIVDLRKNLLLKMQDSFEHSVRDIMRGIADLMQEPEADVACAESR